MIQINSSFLFNAFVGTYVSIAPYTLEFIVIIGSSGDVIFWKVGKNIFGIEDTNS